MQRQGNPNVCIHNRVLQGCINPLQSRLILRQPGYLDLRLRGLQLSNREFVSCDVLPTPLKAYVFNNRQVPPGSAAHHQCLTREAEESDFFIKTGTHHINILVNPTTLQVSCAPTLNVTINGVNISCQTGSKDNPAFSQIHSFRLGDEEYIAETIFRAGSFILAPLTLIGRGKGSDFFQN